MKTLRNIIAMLLACMLVLSVACAESPVYGAMEQEGLFASLLEHDDEKHPGKYKPVEEETEIITYTNLPAALLELQKGTIGLLSCEKSTAEYIAARNDNFDILVFGGLTGYSMMTMEERKEVFDLLNGAIVAMKADGTLDNLIETELKAYIESEPVTKDLPEFDGAKTITIGVTGDVPPMDFVAANGKAAGFNIALLTEIANRSQINIELVQIETGARAMALASGKVDAVFWTKGLACADCNEPFTEDIPGTIITESYFSDSPAYIILKAE